jgi:hypothetical protein
VTRRKNELPVGIAPYSLTGAVVALGSLWHGRRRRRRARLWRSVARGLELNPISEDRFFRASLSGWLGRRPVRFEHVDLKSIEGTHLVVGCNADIALWPATMHWLPKPGGTPELQIGDPEFDDRVQLGGPPELLRAVLDVETRAVVLELVKHTLRVSGSPVALRGLAGVRDGNIVVSLRDGEYLDSPERLSAIVHSLLDLASRLDPPADLLARIAENSRREPHWRVRLENLAFLAERYPHHFAAREALERGCHDEHPEVRLRAAMTKGAEGCAALLDLAGLASARQGPPRPSVEDSCSARAVGALGEQLSMEQAEEILGSALRGHRLQTARACLESLGRPGCPAVVAPLAKVLAVSQGKLAVTAALALGSSGQAAAEAPLLEALERDSADVRAAAAEALGHVGSVTSVLPLKELATSGDAGAGERRAARQAIAEIQSRLHGASPGQLSLAEGDAGDLSLADEDPKGRVSLTDP